MPLAVKPWISQVYRFKIYGTYEYLCVPSEHAESPSFEGLKVKHHKFTYLKINWLGGIGGNSKCITIKVRWFSLLEIITYTNLHPDTYAEFVNPEEGI